MIGFKRNWIQKKAFKMDNAREKAREFAEMFGDSLIKYGFLKIPAHIVSGCLAGYMIFKKLRQVVGGDEGFVGVGVLIGLAVLMALMIEVGMSATLPIWFRQLFRFRWRRWWLFMFGVNGMFAILFLVASPLTTYFGSKDVLEAKSIVYEPQSRDSINGMRDSMLRDVEKEYGLIGQAQDSIMKGMVNNNSRMLGADLKKAKNERYRFNILVDSGRVDLTENRFMARSDVSIRRNEKVAGEAALALARGKMGLELEREYRAERFQVRNWYDKEERKLVEIDDKREGRVEELNSGLMVILVGGGLVAVAMIFLITMVREIYKRGGDIEEPILVWEVGASRFLKTTTLFKKSFYFYADRILLTWENLLPDPGKEISLRWLGIRTSTPGGGMGGGVVNKVGYGRENVVTLLANETTTIETDVDGAKIPMFIHTSGKKYKEEQCWNNKAAWISKLGNNETVLRDWQGQLLRDEGNERLRKKTERKKKTIANNRENIIYWDNAANGLLAEKIKMKLI